MHGKWRVLVIAVGVALFCQQTTLALTPLPSDEYLTRKFRAADANGDDRLSREEYMKGWWYDREQGKQQFQKRDKNRDGFISLDEYLAPMRERRQKQRRYP